MSASETPKSYDLTVTGVAPGPNSPRRSAAFRYAAVAVCGIGLAAACSTFLRLAQGDRERPATAEVRPVPSPAGSVPSTAPANTPESPRPRVLAIEPSPPAVPPEPATASVPPPAPPAPLSPTQSSKVEDAPASQVRPVPVVPAPERAAIRPSPRTDTVRAEPAPVPGPERPAQQQERARSPTPQPTRQVQDKPSAGPSSRQTLEAARSSDRVRRANVEPDIAAQFRAAPAPSGSASNVRAYSLGAAGGRVLDGSGTRVITVGVR